MYLDFEENRPDIPRVPAGFSRLEVVLISLLTYALLFIGYLLAPAEWFAPNQLVPLQAQAEQPREQIRFVDIRPLVDRPAPPKPNAPDSDLDRRAATRERAPVPENADPAMRGVTPEKVVAPPPPERMLGPENATPPSLSRPTPPASSSPSVAPPSPTATPLPNQSAQQQQAAAAPSGNLGQSLRNLQRYLNDQSYNNPRGGNAEQNADIQFDSKGADFGPWLRRFKAQIERNWLVPQAAMSLKGRVVIQFVVLQNGTIIDLRVVQPSHIEAFTRSAANALTLSNPTAKLPPDYPDDRVLFTVTFHYNEWDDR
jgi:TonB family protein